MNTLQIDCFLAIVEYGNFSNASRNLYISQPTISKHIHNLETELGACLFDRTKTPIQLTSIGELYYQLFREFYKNLKKIQTLSQKFDAAFEGNIKIGILSGWNIPSHLNSCLTSFSKKYPHVKILFENHNVRDSLKKLEKGAVDVCFNLLDFIMSKPDITYEKLFDIPKYLVYSEMLMSDKNVPVTMSDFQNQIFFCLGEENSDPTRSKMIEYCKYYGFHPVIKSFPNIESVMSNVEFGNGVTILDSLTQFNESNFIKKIEIQPCHTVCLAWLKNNDDKLIQLLKEELGATYENACSPEP